MTFEDVAKQGFCKTFINLPVTWRNYCLEGNWETLYQEATAAMKPGQWLSNYLKALTAKDYEFELMLSQRVGPQDEEDEGIWHDDASRDMAFSLSLTLDELAVSGGTLGLRKKNDLSNLIEIPTQKYGTLLCFPTGKYGWDHKIARVTQGKRLVLVGWLTFK